MRYSSDLKVVVILLLLTSIFFWKVILNPGTIIYPASDLINTIEPWKLFQYNSFQQYNQLPLWNPYETAGTTFIGNVLNAMFYPLNALYFFIYPDYVFGFVFLFDVAIAGISMFFLAKQLGIEKYGSFLAAIAFMFGGIFIGTINIGHTYITDIYSITPLIFLFLIKGLEKKRYAIIAGIIFGLQILAGYPQFSIYTAYAIILFMIYELVTKFEIKKIIPFVMTFLVAFLVASPQLLPSLELAKYSIHAGGSINYQFLTSPANSYSLTPRFLVSFVLPDFFGFRLDHTYWANEQFEEVIAYLGIIPLALSLLAFWKVRNKYAIFFMILGAIALFFSFGQYNPLFPYIHKLILFFDTVRNPARFLFLFALSFSILAGFGLDYLMKIKKNDKQLLTLVKLFAFLSIIVLVFTFLALGFKNQILSIGNTQLDKLLNQLSADRIGNYVLDFYQANRTSILANIYNYIVGDSFKLFGILALFTGLLYFRNRIGIKYFAIILIAITIGDMWMFGMKYIDVAPLEKAFPTNSLINYISSYNSTFRVMALNRTLETRVATRNNVQILDGFIPTSLQYYADYVAAMENMTLTADNPLPVLTTVGNQNMLDLLNVKYIISPKPINDNFTLVMTSNVINFDIRKLLYFNEIEYLYRNDNAMPRVFVVSSYAVMGKPSILKELTSPSFNPREEVLLEENPSVTNSTDGAWSANILYYSPNEIDLLVNMSQPGFLVLSEVWYPSWKSYVDGEQTPIYNADYIFRSIYLNAGQHQVKFVYKYLGGLA